MAITTKSSISVKPTRARDEDSMVGCLSAATTLQKRNVLSKIEIPSVSVNDQVRKKEIDTWSPRRVKMLLLIRLSSNAARG